MEVFRDVIKEHDATLLYVIFGFQCCVVFLGFPLLLMQCSSAQKRLNMRYMPWIVKWTLVCTVGKWMLETYDLVEQQANQPADKVVKDFDPYKLLHIPNDGSFDTEEI